MSSEAIEIYADPDNQPPVGTAEHAMWLVHWHVKWEEQDRIDDLGSLYHDDIVWEMHFPFETPRYEGKENVLNNYRGLLSVLPDLGGPVVRCFATPDSVFIDQDISYTTVIPPGVPKEGLLASDMLPEGKTMHGRLLHAFHIKGGLIAKETAYFIPKVVTEPAA